MKDFKTLQSNIVNKGIQYKVKYPNGYGALIEQYPYSYEGEHGLWEITVLKDDVITYNTPITSYILGRLSEDDVNLTLDRIESLT